MKPILTTPQQEADLPDAFQNWCPLLFVVHSLFSKGYPSAQFDTQVTSFTSRKG